MKKKILIILVMLILIITSGSFAEQKKGLEERVAQLESEIQALHDEMGLLSSNTLVQARLASDDCRRYAYEAERSANEARRYASQAGRQ